MKEDEQYQILIKSAQNKRRVFVNSNEYATFLMNILVQMLNLNDSHYSQSDFTLYKPNIELLSFYKEYLELNGEFYKERNTIKMQYSLDSSLYASIEPELLSFELQRLECNNEDSFLIIPMTVAFWIEEENDWTIHEIALILKRIDMYITVEVVDKSVSYIKSRDISPTRIYRLNKEKLSSKGIVSYCYEIELHNINQLANILKLGLSDVRFQTREIKKIRCQEVFFSGLSKISSKEYYSKTVGTYQQYLGNCLGKELDAAIRICLGTKQYSLVAQNLIFTKGTSIKAKFLYEFKPPQCISEIYREISILLIMRFEQLKFNMEILKPMVLDFYVTYRYLKSCRQGSAITKKIQTTISSKVYSNESLTVPKLYATNFSLKELKIDVLKISVLRSELEGMNYPRSLESFKKEIKKYPRKDRKEMHKSIKFIK
ncbi:hypothetical protein [Lactococcus lactis]|uniref:hypothetical protein n=1 Tax=Lactococcus lactis TaxID=1358 RepID=UPI001D18AC53|nr:hypothetical protein [Lactococcus lactis]MCC4121973.1 hypothetical protein [Lactococcus lactis]